MKIHDFYEQVVGPEKCWPGYRKVGTKPGTGRNAGKRVNDCEKIREFAPDSSGDDGGDDGFSEETLKKFAAQWYNGDEDPQVEKTLMAAGWEIGQDEGYDDEPGVFVVQAGDINGHSFISWPANELREGVAEGSEQYYAIVHKVNNKPLSTHRNLESAKDEWRGLDQNQRQFYKVVTTKKAPKDWSMKEQGVSEGEREHGSAYDRGAADSWYGRPYNPQKYSDAAAQAEYKAGYDENESQASMRKDYDDDSDDVGRDELEEQESQTVEVVISDGTQRQRRRVRVSPHTRNLEAAIIRYYEKLGLPVVSINGRAVRAQQ